MFLRLLVLYHHSLHIEIVYHPIPLTPFPLEGKGEVVLRGGLRPLFFIFYSSPSPRMERGIKGVRLINNLYKIIMSFPSANML